MQKISLSVELVNAILGYLDTRPHNEVRRLIDAIQQDAQQSAQSAQPAAEEPKPE